MSTDPKAQKKTTRPFVRWRVVVLVDFVLCVAAVIIIGIWYATALVVPSFYRIQRENMLEIQLLNAQIMRVGKFVHLY